MSGEIYLRRRERFSAAHRLVVPGYSDEQNEEAFGICRHNHGHNFDFYVTLKGKPDSVTGMIMNLKDLKAILRQHIVDRYDHRDLNDFDEFRVSPPSVENLAIQIWTILEPLLSGLLYKVEVIETENNSAEYYG